MFLHPLLRKPQLLEDPLAPSGLRPIRVPWWHTRIREQARAAEIRGFLLPIETLATTHFSSEEAMAEDKKAMVEAAHEVTIDHVKIERQRDRETHLTSTLDLSKTNSRR